MQSEKSEILEYGPLNSDLAALASVLSHYQ